MHRYGDALSWFVFWVPSSRFWASLTALPQPDSIEIESRQALMAFLNRFNHPNGCLRCLSLDSGITLLFFVQGEAFYGCDQVSWMCHSFR